MLISVVTTDNGLLDYWNRFIFTNCRPHVSLPKCKRNEFCFLICVSMFSAASMQAHQNPSNGQKEIRNAEQPQDFS